MIIQGTNAAVPARATPVSTAVILCGLAVTGFVLPSEGAVAVFTVAAYVIGLSLSLATGIEARAGVRGLIRADILMLWVLYGLTFLEFLFPQPDVDALVSHDAATSGTHAVLLGFAGIAVGRHCVPRSGRPRKSLLSIQVKSVNIFALFLIAAVVGYLHIFLAVNFDPLEMLRQMSLPRFSQSWSRGKYGDVYSLLYELGMLIALIPPIAGLIYARQKEFSIAQKVVVTGILVLTLYYGFSSGTRNVIATYAITFAGTYFLAKPRIKMGSTLLIGMATLIFLLVTTNYMLEFRNIGLAQFSFERHQHDTIFIDHNMVNISQLTNVFPSSIEFLGVEVPFNALVRPIPRFLWPDKPEGLSTSIESALGADGGMTLSLTFVGEAYMAGGLIAVFLFGLFFGAASEKWNRVGHNVISSFAQLLYASGFLCAAVAMRSVLSMVPLMLPTLALWLYIRYWLPRSPSYRLPREITGKK
jgi:oligosaccharide repeat unit polymerase